MLWQKVAKSTTPQEIVASCAEFWPNTFADYWQEYATISKLLAGITGKVASEAQTLTLDADRATTGSKSGLKVRRAALPVPRAPAPAEALLLPQGFLDCRQ